MLVILQDPKGFKIWLPDKNKIVETLNVSFNKYNRFYPKGSVLEARKIDVEKEQFPITIEEQEKNEEKEQLPTLKNLRRKMN